MAPAAADPGEIAEAALAGCEPRFLAYRDAVRQFFTAPLRSAEGREGARMKADIKAEETRRALGGIAMRRVIQARQ